MTEVEKDEIIELTRKVRAAQKRYFKTRSHDALHDSKQLEKQLDEKLEERLI